MYRHMAGVSGCLFFINVHIILCENEEHRGVLVTPDPICHPTLLLSHAASPPFCFLLYLPYGQLTCAPSSPSSSSHHQQHQHHPPSPSTSLPCSQLTAALLFARLGFSAWTGSGWHPAGSRRWWEKVSVTLRVEGWVARVPCDCDVHVCVLDPSLAPADMWLHHAPSLSLVLSVPLYCRCL